MNYLLDTHVLIWWLLNSENLTKKHREIISSSKNRILVSAVSIWEISIKTSLKKLSIPSNFFEKVETECDFEPLSISFRHAMRVAHLPSHHSDPFDRLLVAQAKEEEIPLLSVNKNIGLYKELITVL